MRRNLFLTLGGGLLATFVLGGCGTKDAAKTLEEKETEIVAESEIEDDAEQSTEDVYTVYFDANTTPDDLTDDESFSYWTQGWDSKKKSSVITYPATDDAYILADDVPVPTRKGYYFAGWQTVPVVTEDDIIDGVSKYQMFFDTKISSLGEDAIKNKSSEEVSARGLEQEVNYIKDMENLTEDGTVTFYARWVEAKEISTEEDLKNIKNDLYGAYVLTEDITLTEPWEPIGQYFTNYEYYNIDWWTYAFRGTLDGQGHTISGMVIESADIENPGFDQKEDARWYADGSSCAGAAGLFGAASKATFKNLTLESPVITITGDSAYSGDHLYTAAFCCFDMGSSLTDIVVDHPSIQVQYNDSRLKYATSLFTSIGGLEAGSWSTNVTSCKVIDGKISADVVTQASHGGEIYVGGILGECYSSVKNSNSSTEISLNVNDKSEALTDENLIVNVGGAGAANAAASATETNNKIYVSVQKEQGKSSVNIGGYTGAQRYQQISGCKIRADITTDCKLDEEQGTMNVGAAIGRMDMFYATLILKYADGVKCGCTGNETEVTYNGEPYKVLLPDSGYPMLEGEKVSYVATKDVTDEESGIVYQKNLDDIVDAYGSYLPKDGLTKDILYIEVE